MKLDAGACLIQLQAARFFRRGRGGRPHAAQDGAHPGADLAGREGFGHIVVGAHLQPQQTVDLLAARSQKQQWQLADGADAAAELEAADIRQSDIQDQKIGLLVVHRLQQRQAALEPAHGKAVGLQAVDQGVGNAGFIFHQPDQRARHGGCRVVRDSMRHKLP